MKTNAITLSVGYYQVTFDNLSPQEIGQLSKLLEKAISTDNKYHNGHDYVVEEPRHIKISFCTQEIMSQDEFRAMEEQYEKEQAEQEKEA